MRAFAVLLALGADAAWNLAGPFWGFTVLAFLVLWIALNQAHIATGSKAYRLEQRLNAVMPRIPNPQNSPGTAGNSSYSPGNTSYTSGNSSYNVGSAPTAADFNALRNSYSDTVAAFNNHIGDHGNFVVAVQALRTDHSNLVTSHNAVITTLNNTNLTH